MESEWSLVFFTLSGQAAAGLTLALALMSVARKRVLELVYLSVRQPVTLLSLLLMAAAVFFSFFHLGSPSSAVYALSNLKGSWLSREILMVISFSMLLLIRWVLLRNRGGRTTDRLMLWLCVAAGFAMVHAMARVYMIPAVPVWNHTSTLVQFHTTALLLGFSLFISFLIMGNVVHPDKHGTGNFLMILVYVIIAAFLLQVLFPLPRDYAAGSAGFPPEAAPVLLMLPWYFFLSAGTILFSVWAFFPVKDERLLRYLVHAGFFCFLLAGVVGRYLFYSGYYRLGI